MDKSRSLMLAVLMLIFTSTVSAGAYWAKLRDVCFTYTGNNKDCRYKIANTLKQANQFIVILSYYFTDKWFTRILLTKEAEGVETLLLTNAPSINLLNSGIPTLKTGSFAGHKAYTGQGIEVIPIKMPADTGIFHNKVIITARKDRWQRLHFTIVTGSYNFAPNSYKRHAENMVFIESHTLAKTYLASICRYIPHKLVNYEIYGERYQALFSPGLLTKTLHEVCS